MFKNFISGTPVQIIYDLGQGLVKDSVCFYIKSENNTNYFLDGEDGTIFGFSNDFIKKKNIQIIFENLDFNKLAEAIITYRKYIEENNIKLLLNKKKSLKSLLESLKPGNIVKLVYDNFFSDNKTNDIFIYLKKQEGRYIFYDIFLESLFAFGYDFAIKRNMNIISEENIKADEINKAIKSFSNYIKQEREIK